MGTNRIQEQKLDIDISFNEIDTRLVFATVQQISIFDSNKVMETIFYCISVNHLLVCLLNL